MSEFISTARIDAPAADVWAWLSRPGALHRLLPPWEKAVVRQQTTGIESGGRTVLAVTIAGIKTAWIAEYQDVTRGREFSDVQVSGPFAAWTHTHRIEPASGTSCILEDRIDYRLPLHAVSGMVARRAVEHRLARMFRYRHDIMAADLACHRRFADRGSLRILISGSSGLIGSQLTAFLSTGGHDVTRLIRRPPTAGEKAILWNPVAGMLNAESLEGFDAVIHLAGENLASGRWTPERRKRLWQSRVDTTQLLSTTLAKLRKPPRVMITASGTGWYGDGGDRELTEDSPRGSGFLADIVAAWEAAAEPASAAGIRVVNARLGTVLSPMGGALKQMLPSFRLGAGTILGTGREYTAWLTLDDVLGMIHHAIFTESLRGPVNFNAPQAVTQREFSRNLATVLKRPVFLNVPFWAISLLFSRELAEALSWSQRISPAKLTSSGYTFRHPDLESAFRHILGRNLSADK